MSKKYIVSLTADERLILSQLTKKGKSPAYKVNHARILLKADTNTLDGGWTDEAISMALDISIPTIERVRKSFVELGLEAALNREKPVNRKYLEEGSYAGGRGQKAHFCWGFLPGAIVDTV